MPNATILSPVQRAFAAAARTATLATMAPSGRPRLVPICHVVGSDDADGRPRLYSPLDEKPKRSADPHELARARDLLVLPEATLLIDRWSEDWSRLGWLRLDGRAELLEPEPGERAGRPEQAAAGEGVRGEHASAVERLRRKYSQYADHRLEERPIIRITVEHALSWGDLALD
jgi:PPOX class probable F420-dependent enzyme